VTVAPAAFATGEMVQASGKDVLRAYAIGVEIKNKIAALVMPAASSNGWHTTSSFVQFRAVGSSALRKNWVFFMLVFKNRNSDNFLNYFRLEFDWGRNGDKK